MKKEVLLTAIFVFLFIFQAMAAASAAADVAYILNIPSKVKPEILNIFSEMNLSVDIIKDSKVPTTNLAAYRMVFVDDARLPKTKKIAIYNYPSVIMNKYYGKDWGLTDGDGISQLSATAPLNVKLVDNGVRQVYTSAR